MAEALAPTRLQSGQAFRDGRSAAYARLACAGSRLACGMIFRQKVGPAHCHVSPSDENDMTMLEANGARIPPIGLGTMTLHDAVCVEAVKTALRLGYRHLDTAERYGNEAAVGEGLHQGLREIGLKREDVLKDANECWVTSRVALTAWDVLEWHEKERSPRLVERRTSTYGRTF